LAARIVEPAGVTESGILATATPAAIYTEMVTGFAPREYDHTLTVEAEGVLQ
jgi:hypothetical protein